MSPAFNHSRRQILSGPMVIGLTTAQRPVSGLATISAPSADATFTLGNPSKGFDLTVLAAINSTKVIAIRTNSSAQTFFGSTADKITLTTGARLAALRFVGISTSQWGVIPASNSTAAMFTLAGSTR